MKRMSFTTSNGTVVSCFLDVICALYYDENGYYVRLDEKQGRKEYEIDYRTYSNLFRSKEIEGLLSFAN